MAIISPLPYTIANGDPVDATPVMADLTQIVYDVNANAANVAGDASQQFLVATTANPAGAVPLAQAQAGFAAINGSSAQVFNVANAATATEAVALGQAQADFAALNGSSEQVFNVANAVTATEAVALGQAQADFAALNGSSAQVFNVAHAATNTEATPRQQTIGNGATAYSNVTSSRALNTAYTNAATRPLFVCASVQLISGSSTQAAGVTVYVGPYQLLDFAADFSLVNATYIPVTFLVPPGASYNISMYGVTSGSVTTWFEY